MGFEPLQATGGQPNAGAGGGGRFQPLNPTYNYIAPEPDDTEETIMFHGGSEVKAPVGTGRMFTEISNDSTFDRAPASTLDETVAVFDKQAAYLGLIANAYGLVPDDQIAPFVADRSRALANAQKNQPEYMKKFQSEFENAKGFWETTGVMLSNPRAIGRTAITQSPNSALPLLTTYIGAQSGAVAGGLAGSVVPGVGNIAGATVGAIGGGALGAVPGGALVEIGATIDQLMAESGVDVTDASQVLTALQNDKLMSDIKIKAEKKGITTATVDALFQVVGGRFVKSLGGIKGAATDMAVQSAGEFTGEAAGQQAAFGKVDYKDAAMEAVSAIAQSAGQTAIGATVGLAKPKTTATGEEPLAVTPENVQQELAPAAPLPLIDPETAKPVAQADIDGNVDESPFTPPVMAATAEDDIPFDIPAFKSPEAKAALESSGIDLSAISPKQARDFGAALENVARNVPNAIEHIKAQQGKGFIPMPKQRPQTLSQFLISKGGIINDTEEARRYTKKETPALKGVTKKTGKLTLDEARALAVEAGFILDPADPDMPTLSSIDDLLDALESEADGRAIVRGQDLRLHMEREAIADYNDQIQRLRDEQYPGDFARGLNEAFRRGVSAAKKDVKEAQAAIIDILEKSGLNAEDKAKFIRSIKNIDSAEKAAKVLPDIQARVESLLDTSTRRDAIKKISKLAKNARRSQTIAADMAREIIGLVNEIDLGSRGATTQARLEAMEAYYGAHPDERAPKSILNQLKRLDKKKVEDVTTEDLTSLLGELRRLTNEGRKKQKAKKDAAEQRQMQRLNEMAGKLTPMSARPLATASIGERLGLMDSVKNRYINAANYARQVSLALNPMDVFFDMMDGNADYKGAAHTIFKKTIDKSFGKYLDLKEKTTRDVKNMADELNLDDRNFERIGVYAAAKQQDGIKKLVASGLTEEEINAITLTPDEMKFYKLMRKKLDEMYPAISEVMIDVYNKNVEQVGDYFPFMTDFDAMKDTPIQDMLGNDAPIIAAKRKNVEKGFTESRTGAATAIRLDAMNVFMRHVDNAAYLIEMSKDVKELGELAQSEGFLKIAGDMSQQFVTDWIDLLARKGRAPNRVNALDALRVNAGAAVLGYKLSSVLIQPTALMDGAALVGGDYVARGVSAVATDEAWRKFLKANLPEIRERVGDDPAYIDMGGKSAIAKVREAGFWALKNIDLLTASSVAAGAYMRSVEQRGGVVDFNNPDPVAIEEAQLYLRRTQSSAFAKDQPQVISTGKLSGNASLDKMIFQFQSFMLNRWSVIRHDIAAVGIGRGKTQQAVNAATFLLLAGMTEIGVRRLSKELIAALVGGDDLEPWEKTIDEEAVRTGIGMLPIVGNITGSLEFGSVPVPSVSLINDIFKKLSYAAKSKSADKKAKHYTSAMILLLGVTFGIPGTMQAEQLSRKLQDEEKNRKTAF